MQDDLYNSIQSYHPENGIERTHQSEILEFIRTHTNPFDRQHLHAHLTGSAIILDATAKYVLLGFHRKLQRWLQMGGHGESGEVSAEAVAYREAVEESGILDLRLHPTAPRPLDLDVHVIPARSEVPEHRHLDIRYLFIAPELSGIVHREDEHHSVRWFAWHEIEELELDESLHRALKKALTHSRPSSVEANADRG